MAQDTHPFVTGYEITRLHGLAADLENGHTDFADAVRDRIKGINEDIDRLNRDVRDWNNVLTDASHTYDEVIEAIFANAKTMDAALRPEHRAVIDRLNSLAHNGNKSLFEKFEEITELDEYEADRTPHSILSGVIREINALPPVGTLPIQLHQGNVRIEYNEGTEHFTVNLAGATLNGIATPEDLGRLALTLGQLLVAVMARKRDE